MQKEIEKISVLKNFWLMIKYTDKSVVVIDLLFSPLKENLKGTQEWN